MQAINLTSWTKDNHRSQSHLFLKYFLTDANNYIDFDVRKSVEFYTLDKVQESI
jgi:hypothetical protein